LHKVAAVDKAVEAEAEAMASLKSFNELTSKEI
jgi:hypothetical protein